MAEWNEETRKRLETARLANTNPADPLGVLQGDIAAALEEIERLKAHLEEADGALRAQLRGTRRAEQRIKELDIELRHAQAGAIEERRRLKSQNVRSGGLSYIERDTDGPI